LSTMYETFDGWAKSTSNGTIDLNNARVRFENIATGATDLVLSKRCQRRER
jgi:hypothetical protein